MTSAENKIRGLLVVAVMVLYSLFMALLEVTVKFYDVAEIPVKLWILVMLGLVVYDLKTTLSILWSWIRVLPPRERVLVWDDAGLWLSARDWTSKYNQEIERILSDSRRRREAT